MKLDKEQQKHFAEAIRNASKKKGFKVKGCSIYDDIFWKVLQMPSNSKQADSLRAVGAFKAPSILIEKGQDIKQELLHRYKTILPDELIKIWEDNGLARLMGGYLKVVNPEDYQELLKETYFRGNISIPILVTALGDIVTFEEDQYIGMVKYKNGNFVMLAKNFKRFIQNLGDDYFLEKYFQIPQYIEAVNKLGKLEQDECFGYVPLLGLGGSEKIQNLKKVKIREYIELISQLVGKIGM